MKKKAKFHKTVWINKGMFPLFIAFCPNEKAWNTTMKAMDVVGCPYPTADARVTYFRSGKGDESVIITVADRFGKETCPVSLSGLLIHEVTHVKQRILKVMREKKVSSEMEAYLMQDLSVRVMDAFCETRHVLYKGWKPN